MRVLLPGLEPEGTPHLGDGGLGDPVLGGQAPRRPVGVLARGVLEGVDEDRFDHVVTDGARRPRTGGIDEPVEPVNREPVPPRADRDRVAPQIRSDPGVGASAPGAGQHDLGTQRQRLGRRMPLRPPVERRALVTGQDDLDRRSSPSCCHGVPPMLVDNTGTTRPRYPNLPITQELLAEQPDRTLARRYRYSPRGSWDECLLDLSSPLRGFRAEQVVERSGEGIG